MSILFDETWAGAGGIGRFAEEVASRISYDYGFKLSGSPASPLSALKLSLEIGKNDIAILPGYIPPLMCRGKFLFTIHDLNHIDRPENTSILKKFFYRYVIRRGCNDAYKVLTVSEFSRQKIIEWSGVDSDKVVCVGNGVGSNFNAEVEPFDAGSPYYLSVGNRKLHKNEFRILESFFQANIDQKIVLAFTGSPSSELDVRIKKLGLSERVVFFGSVEEAQLPKIYKGARGLLFPSLYEGFGLPVIEAMACGTPVITSNVTSLPEVAGDAAILINPMDVDELKEAIERLENDPRLRSELVIKGYDRAKFFTWEKTAHKIQEVLNCAQAHNSGSNE